MSPRTTAPESSRAKAFGLMLPALLLVVASGCLERQGRPVSPCTQSSTGQTIQVDSVDRVDLLLMIDNSNSMANNQNQLAAELPPMIETLTSGMGDGIETFDAVRDLNVGIITSDMGTAGYVVPTCDPPMFGDDGILMTRGRTAIMGCQASYDPIFNYRPDDSPQSPEEFAFDVSCVALLGTGGCGFEQQLEAPLKALSPSVPQAWTAPGYEMPPFFANAVGHADGANNGFVRENSVLAIILLTDEEDCSFNNPEIANPDPGSTYGGTNLNLRCVFHPEALHSVNRYVDGFLQLRRSPGQLVFAPIVGIPRDLAPTGLEAPDWRAIYDDPRMVQEEDPARPNRLRPSCNEPGIGEADPPRRIVEVAEGLANAGAGVTVQSICQNSFANALNVIIQKIADALGQACLPRELNPRADGSVDCDVVGIAPEGTECGEVEGSEPQTNPDGSVVRVDGRAVCVIQQLVPTAEDRAARRAPDGRGWYYDNYTAQNEESCPDAQRIAFTAQPPGGTEVRLECLQAVAPSEGEIAVGTFCGEMDTCPSGRAPDNTTALSCDPVQRTCGVQCANDADCRSAGLVGFVCDRRPRSVIDPENFPGDETPYEYCVNPTC